jgi:hypothetical protein
LTTTRCSHPLCNTQHTTTPQPQCRHHNHTPQTGQRIALGRPGRERHREQHPTGVSSGPNSVRTRRRLPPQTWQQPAMPGTSAVEVFHPATPTTDSQPGTSCMIRCGISERRDTHPSEVHIPTSPNGETP